jgi:hypothetical protein
MNAIKFSLAFCVLLSTTLFVLPGQNAPQTSDEEGRILALENLWNRAEQTKDAAALDQLLAPSLIYIDYDGSIMTKDRKSVV